MVRLFLIRFGSVHGSRDGPFEALRGIAATYTSSLPLILPFFLSLIQVIPFLCHSTNKLYLSIPTFVRETNGSNLSNTFGPHLLYILL
ncbi:hypothetical protein MTR_5g098000 [Medicago truncatula]|uniref:Uncharacterized protein n=1 Tax=Medicago truncatula TaxID=3880 RepID=G7K4Z8_MEDTR|nr:hypothetical protein MTR_5g098000 [Medicago truncatula]